TTTHVAVTTDTAQGVVDAINAKGLAVRAALVTTDQGTMLQLTATKTGTANGFSVAGLASAPAVAIAAADAKIQVGDPASGGYTVSSSSNTFTGLVSGVTLTANRLQDGVTVSVNADSGAVADKVKAMVDAANNALGEISTQAAYGSAGKAGGPLSSDYTVRQLQSKVLSTV